MSSSDSDDDCYGNVVNTLHSLKNNFHEDKLESAKLLEHCIAKNENENSGSRNAAPSTELDNTLSDGEEIDKIIALHSTRTTRETRRSKRNEKPSCAANTVQKPTRSRGRGRGRGRKRDSFATISPTSLNTCSTSLNTCSTSPPVNPWTLRGRGRNARRRGTRGAERAARGRIGRNSMSNAFIQTFAIGNCEEYDDLSNNIQLFSKNNTTSNAADVEAVKDDSFDENEELSVKVIWQSIDIVKFTIRRYQKIVQIFEYFTDKTKSSIDKLLFIYNDKILKPDDTPDSIDYSIAKFIEGGVVSSSVSLYTAPNMDSKPSSGIKIKFQYPNSKKAFEVYVAEDELLSVSMMKCAEHMEVPIKRLKFEFDGDYITGHMTAKALDMEGGECIDVKIIS